LEEEEEHVYVNQYEDKMILNDGDLKPDPTMPLLSVVFLRGLCLADCGRDIKPNTQPQQMYGNLKFYHSKSTFNTPCLPA
jgi:hypothetical protein